MDKHKDQLNSYDDYKYAFIIKPGSWAYRNDVDNTDQHIEIVRSKIDVTLADEAKKAMLISTMILTVAIGSDIYQHMKSFCIALGLPFANRGETTYFHVFAGGLLACLQLCQILISSGL